MASLKKLAKAQEKLRQAKERVFIARVVELFKPISENLSNSLQALSKTFKERFERLAEGIKEQNLQIIEKIDSKNNDDVKEQVKSLENVIKKKDFRGPKGERGEKGKRGEKGERGEKGLRGKAGKAGKDGKDGKDGKEGKDGKDGSPDTPKEIKNKLESIKKESNKLSRSAISGLDKTIKQLRVNAKHGARQYTSSEFNLSELGDVDVSSLVDNYILKWDAASSKWTAEEDLTATGDITSVSAGSGLSGGGTTGDVTLTLDESYTDNLYLKLDASNDPITGNLLIKPTSNSTSAFGVQQADGTQVFNVDTTNGRVGIGTDSPTALLELLHPSATAAYIDTAYSNTTSGATYSLRKRRGNAGTAIIVNDGDTTGTLYFEGYDGNSYEPTASIGSKVSGTPGDNLMPGSLILSTAKFGSLLGRLVINEDGKIIVGKSVGAVTPDARFHVHGLENEIQQIIQANATQTANLTEWQDSGGTDLLTVEGDGSLNGQLGKLKNFTVYESPQTGTASDLVLFRSLRNDTVGGTAILYQTKAADGSTNKTRFTIPSKQDIVNIDFNTANLRLLGNILYGDNAAGGNLALSSTTSGTKGAVQVSANSNFDVLGGTTTLNGTSDAVQLTVQAHSTQTNLLSVWEDSSGNDQITFSGDGAVVFNEQGNDADFRVEASGQAHALFVQGSDGKVGIGNASPGYTLDIRSHTGGVGRFVGASGLTGVAPSSQADEFVLENNEAYVGLSLLSNSTSTANIFFGDTDDNNKFRIQYKHSDDKLYFNSAGTNRVVFESTGNVGIGTTSPTAKLHVKGTSNHIQQIVQANATQTANLVEYQNSGGTKLACVDKAGVFTMGEVTTPTAVANYGKIYPKSDNRLYFQDGAGTEHTVHGFPTYKSYNISTQGLGANPDVYAAGFLEYSATDANLTQASTTVATGTANLSYAAHAFIVAGGAGATDGSDLVLTVTGTSITDEGVRTTSDSEVIVADCTAAALDGHFETSKKWLGQITLTLSSTGGTAFSFDFNYGLVKYEDFNNEDFTVVGIEAVGLAGANDSNFNIKLMHYNSTWTYAATGFDPIVAGNTIASLVTDHSTDDQLKSGEHFAWKRDNLNTVVNGSGSEGIIIRVESSANNAVEYCNIHLAVSF